ncbi:hypothetical protein TsocGM_16540 [Tautonia sociabilis]|uniref:PpiC domain-containing protein n=2 Tax=Tautonia sociabilis TaxID=2080755 RepID=A0A432MHA7_9BACT|nr:hypothetical protein TsocGM_16540 [Tautonia sociabilis]
MLIGCGQTRDGVRPTAGLAPAAMPDGLPPIEQQVNSGPFPSPPAGDSSAPVVRTSGVHPGINGERAVEPPRLSSSTVPGSAESPPVATPARLASHPARPPAAPAPPSPTATSAQGVPENPGAVASHREEVDLPPPTASGGDGDAAVARASATEPPAPIGQPIGEWAARVDNDIITWNELQSAVARRLREIDPEGQATAEMRTALAQNILDHLIDRSLVIQKARRNELKDPKRWEMINKGAVDYFQRERLPGLLNQYKAQDRFELERILAERGESFEEILESFKLEFIYQQYLVMNVTSKIRVDLPEMRAYYHEHRDHEAFHRDAEITWREVVVRFANHPSRDAARAKAEQALARLARGEPFERVAEQLSEGPNAPQGGMWTSSPGSYSVAEVNQALESLAPGQTSAVIEGPDGLHIVRLESRVPAGRKRFEEVQDEIRDLLKAEKEAEVIDEYLRDLYQGAVVTTVFSEYVPRHLRGDGIGG